MMTQQSDYADAGRSYPNLPTLGQKGPCAQLFPSLSGSSYKNDGCRCPWLKSTRTDGRTQGPGVSRTDRCQQPTLKSTSQFPVVGNGLVTRLLYCVWPMHTCPTR